MLECRAKFFRLLHSVTLGGTSRKQAVKERSELVQLIRHQMSENLIGSGQDGVVMEHELRQAVERRVCMDFLHKTNVRRKTMVRPHTSAYPPPPPLPRRALPTLTLQTNTLTQHYHYHYHSN
jgi:hypothetical protein